MTERITTIGALEAPLSEWGSFLTAESGAGPLEPRLPSDAELIRGELDRTQLDLITFETERHVVRRTSAHVAMAPKRHIFMVQLRGHSTLFPVDTDDTLSLGPGDIGYWTSESPYRWEFTGPFTLLTLRAPFHAVEVAPATLEPLIGRSFPSDRGFARVVVPFAEQVLNDPRLLSSQNGTRIVQNIVSLFTTMLLGELDLKSGQDRSGPAFRRAVDYITEHLAESLDLRSIAEANDMSTRYLQSLFQARGTSVSAWIRLRRLDAARQALADPTMLAMSIGQIAAGQGFVDQAHFSRSFRSIYGESPSAWRERAAVVDAASDTTASL